VLVGGIEREVVSDFSLGVNVGSGVTSSTHWSPFIGLTSDHFEEYLPPLPAGVSLTTPVYKLAPGVTLPPGNGRVLINREGYSKRYWNVDVVATKRLTNKWMFRGFVTWQQHREYFDDPARAIQDPTPRLDAASGFVDGGIAVNVASAPPSDFVIHGTWLYSVAGLYELPWQMSVAGTMYGRQGNPIAEVLTVERPGGLGPTRVFLDRNLDVSRFPGVQLLDARVQKQFALGQVRATVNVDVFNVLNTGSTLRQFTDAVTTTFGRPLEIVAPRLVRLGLQLQF
jgi:hypothetical protein